MNKKQPDFVELLRFWCSVEPALRGARAGFANRAGVSAKPLHFRRRRTAENARVQSRPKIEELAGLFSVTAPALEPALRKAPAIFRASNPKNRAFL